MQNKYDEMIDLKDIFNKKASLLHHTQDYLDSFQHVALIWDTQALSQNLTLEFDESKADGGTVKCLTSLNSFKTVYSQDPMVSGDRYYFEVQFLKGCNFKLGICSNKTNTEVAFCD